MVILESSCVGPKLRGPRHIVPSMSPVEETLPSGAIDERLVLLASISKRRTSDTCVDLGKVLLVFFGGGIFAYAMIPSAPSLPEIPAQKTEERGEVRQKIGWIIQIYFNAFEHKCSYVAGDKS